MQPTECLSSDHPKYLLQVLSEYIAEVRDYNSITSFNLGFVDQRSNQMTRPLGFMSLWLLLIWWEKDCQPLKENDLKGLLPDGQYKETIDNLIKAGWLQEVAGGLTPKLGHWQENPKRFCQLIVINLRFFLTASRQNDPGCKEDPVAFFLSMVEMDKELLSQCADQEKILVAKENLNNPWEKALMAFSIERKFYIFTFLSNLAQNIFEALGSLKEGSDIPLRSTRFPENTLFHKIFYSHDALSFRDKKEQFANASDQEMLRLNNLASFYDVPWRIAKVIAKGRAKPVFAGVSIGQIAGQPYIFIKNLFNFTPEQGSSFDISGSGGAPVIFLTASDSRDVSMAVFDQEMPCASIFSQVINRLLSNDVFLRIIEEKWDTLIFSKVLSEPTEPGQQRLLSMIKFFAPDGQLTDKESFLAFLFYMLVNPAFLGCDFVFGFVLPLFLNCIKNIDFANNTFSLNTENITALAEKLSQEREGQTQRPTNPSPPALVKALLPDLINCGLLDISVIQDTLQYHLSRELEDFVLLDKLPFGQPDFDQSSKEILVDYFVERGFLEKNGAGAVRLSAQKRQEVNASIRQQLIEIISPLPDNTGTTLSRNPQERTRIAEINPQLRGQSFAFKLRLDPAAISRFSQAGEVMPLAIPGFSSLVLLPSAKAARLKDAKTMLILGNGKRVRFYLFNDETRKLTLLSRVTEADFFNKESTPEMSFSSIPCLGKVNVLGATASEQQALAPLAKILADFNVQAFEVRDSLAFDCQWEGNTLVLRPTVLADLSQVDVLLLACNLLLARENEANKKIKIILQLFKTETRPELIKEMEAVVKELPEENLFRHYPGQMSAVIRLLHDFKDVKGRAPADLKRLLLERLLVFSQETRSSDFCSYTGQGTSNSIKLEQWPEQKTRFIGLGVAMVAESQVGLGSQGVDFFCSNPAKGHLLLYVYFRDREGKIIEKLYTLAGQPYEQHLMWERDLAVIEQTHGVDLGFIRKQGLTEVEKFLPATQTVLACLGSEKFLKDTCVLTSLWQLCSVAQGADLPLVRQALLENLVPAFINSNEAEVQKLLGQILLQLGLVDREFESVADWADYINQVVRPGLQVLSGQLADSDDVLYNWLSAIEGRLQAAEQAQIKAGQTLLGEVFYRNVPDLRALDPQTLLNLALYFKARQAVGDDPQFTGTITEVLPKEKIVDPRERALPVTASPADRLSGTLGKVRNLFDTALNGAGLGVQNALQAAINAVSSYPHQEVFLPLTILTSLLAQFDSNNPKKDVTAVRDITPQDPHTGEKIRSVHVAGFSWNNDSVKYYVRLVARRHATFFGQARISVTVFADQDQQKELAAFRIDLEKRGATIDLGGLFIAEALSVRASGYHFASFLPRALSDPDTFSKFIQDLQQRLWAKLDVK